MTTKPSPVGTQDGIQPVAWMYTWKEDAGNKFLGPVLKHVREPSGVLACWDETPLVPVAVLSRVRVMLEAKAKEWQKPYPQVQVPIGAMCQVIPDNKERFYYAAELLSLAATLGNQGK